MTNIQITINGVMKSVITMTKTVEKKLDEITQWKTKRKEKTMKMNKK